MAEIKHTFSTGRMNKDVDERLVPNGEYRDAFNVQVRTTDGDAAGTIQNIEGNVQVGATTSKTYISSSKCVGSVADERNDKAYFLFASESFVNRNPQNYGAKKIYIDYVLEQDSIGKAVPVFVDVFAVSGSKSNAGTVISSGGNWHELTGFNASYTKHYRPGMTFIAYDANGDATTEPGTIITQVGATSIKVNKRQTNDISNAVSLVAIADKTLGFDQNNLITGINVLDDFLFFTDNKSEPKQLNIKACKAGTTSDIYHTKIQVKNADGDYISPVHLTSTGTFVNDDANEKYITVAKCPPRLAPKVEFLQASNIGSNNFTIEGFGGFFNNETGAPLAIGNTVSIPADLVGYQSNLGAGDTLVFSSTVEGLTEVQVTGTVVQVPFSFIFSFPLNVLITNISTNIQSDNTNWSVEIQDNTKSIFLDKFPRFAFRYKYEDNEYSSFSPWSEIAFAPGLYDYNSIEGYNESMENAIKEIRIKDFLEDKRYRPANVKAIDVLYRSTDSPLVYIVKTIERDFSPEWINSQAGVSTDIIISSEMIHLAVPENQSLRVWDNVPRYAKSQEIVGNRLVYGNYTQGYKLKDKPIIQQLVLPNTISSVGNPEKSIKSLRSYKIGLVLGDKYGRETPVIAVGNKNSQTDNISGNQSTETIILDQSSSKFSNKLEVSQQWENNDVAIDVPYWAEYCKYYIKETASEYYNLVLERFYFSQDNQMWLAFPSSDRNKIDEEDYLILKKSAETNDPVEVNNKYKVLSIKNEAPRFIKTKNKIIGAVPIYDAGNQTASNPVQNYDSGGSRTAWMIGHYDTAQEQLNDNDISNIENATFTGQRLARIVCNLGVISNSAINYSIVLRTPYRSVTSFQNETGTVSLIYIDEPFGDSVHFKERLIDTGAFDSTISDFAAGNILKSEGVVQMEIVDSVEKDEPEFEGSFFVKVKRDNVLDNSIVGSSGISAIFDEKTGVVPFKYIDTNSGVNVAQAGTYSSYAWNNVFNSTQINNSEFAICNQSINTRDFWELLIPSFSEDVSSEQPIEEQALSRCWIDGAATKGGVAHEAFGSSSNATGGTLDTIAFSRMKNDEYAGIAMFGLLLGGNTIFSFEEDPNENKYRIIEVLSAEEYYNYGEAPQDAVEFRIPQNDGSGSCALCNPNDSHCKRVRSVVRFERLNDNGINLTNTGIDTDAFDPRGYVKQDGTSGLNISFYELSTEVDTFNFKEASLNPAVFETQPKESVDLDIYYEASSAIPQRLNYKTIGYFAPVNSKVNYIERNGEQILLPEGGYVKSVYDDYVHVVRNSTTGSAYTDSIINAQVNDLIVFEHVDGTITKSKITAWGTFGSHPSTFLVATSPSFNVSAVLQGDDILQKSSGVTPVVGAVVTLAGSIDSNTYIKEVDGDEFTLSKPLIGDIANGTQVQFTNPQGIFRLDSEVYKYSVQLPWFNCYSYGNGVESNRIRDDFNKPFITNGFKASTTFTDYDEENISNGLIYSGLYNSTSSVNELNQFNMAEKITKELNPDYGSIQALKTRNTDLNVFTEDKVLRVLANKDALFNADGSTNVTASDRVLGQAVPYVGEYGISKNPESLASDQYRIYFTDKQRGAVLRLSRDGLTPISNVGMRNYFRDNLADCDKVVGSYDAVNGEYNVTLGFSRQSRKQDTTVSFNEAGKGWVSFKSFIPDSGVSVSGKYYTANTNKIWEHYSDRVNRNTFYGVFGASTFTAILNDIPGTIKTFKTINYEGTKGKSVNVNKQSVSDVQGNTVVASDGLYDNLTAPTDGNGWSATIFTEYQSGLVDDFRGKENKWFGYVIGDQKSESTLSFSDINLEDFSTQGLGIAKTVGGRSQSRTNVEVTIRN